MFWRYVVALQPGLVSPVALWPYDKGMNLCLRQNGQALVWLRFYLPRHVYSVYSRILP
jgi:hypothetical protein